LQPNAVALMSALPALYRPMSGVTVAFQVTPGRVQSTMVAGGGHVSHARPADLGGRGGGGG